VHSDALNNLPYTFDPRVRGVHSYDTTYVSVVGRKSKTRKAMLRFDTIIIAKRRRDEVGPLGGTLAPKG